MNDFLFAYFALIAAFMGLSLASSCGSLSGKQLDIVFLMDTSKEAPPGQNNVTQEKMQAYTKKFAFGFSTFTTLLSTAGADVKMALVSFSGTPRVSNSLASDTQNLVTSMQNNNMDGNSQEAGLEAIRMVVGNSSDLQNGPINYRSGAQKVVILITNEDSDLPTSVKYQMPGQADESFASLDGNKYEPSWSGAVAESDGRLTRQSSSIPVLGDAYQAEVDATAQLLLDNNVITFPIILGDGRGDINSSASWYSQPSIPWFNKHYKNGFSVAETQPSAYNSSKAYNVQCRVGTYSTDDYDKSFSHVGTLQYGNPNIEINDGIYLLTNYDPVGTYEKYIQYNHTNSLQAQVMRGGGIIRSFALDRVCEPDDNNQYISNIYTQIVSMLTACPVTVSSSTQTTSVSITQTVLTTATVQIAATKTSTATVSDVTVVAITDTKTSLSTITVGTSLVSTYTTVSQVVVTPSTVVSESNVHVVTQTSTETDVVAVTVETLTPVSTITIASDTRVNATSTVSDFTVVAITDTKTSLSTITVGTSLVSTYTTVSQVVVTPSTVVSESNVHVVTQTSTETDVVAVTVETLTPVSTITVASNTRVSATATITLSTVHTVVESVLSTTTSFVTTKSASVFVVTSTAVITDVSITSDIISESHIVTSTQVATSTTTVSAPKTKTTASSSTVAGTSGGSSQTYVIAGTVSAAGVVAAAAAGFLYYNHTGTVSAVAQAPSSMLSGSAVNPMYQANAGFNTNSLYEDPTSVTSPV